MLVATLPGMGKWLEPPLSAYPGNIKVKLVENLLHVKLPLMSLQKLKLVQNAVTRILARVG